MASASPEAAPPRGGGASALAGRVSEPGGVRAAAVALLSVACSGGGAGPTLPVPPPAATPTRACGAPAAVGVVASGEVTEASGITASRRFPGILWLHNDSGDTARLFAVDLEGRTRGVALLDATTAFDWEGMARGPIPEGGEAFFVGDFGDNHHERAHIVVERFPEPPLAGSDNDPARAPTPDHLRFVYSDGVAHDAEALVVDRPSGDLYVITKEYDGPSLVFRAQAPHRSAGRRGAPRSLDRVGELVLPVAARSRLVTDAALSEAGDAIIVRTYDDVLLFPRAPGELLEDALARPGRPLPAPDERQGEAVTFLPSAEAYVTVSEGKNPTIWRTSLCPEGAPDDV